MLVEMSVVFHVLCHNYWTNLVNRTNNKQQMTNSWCRIRSEGITNVTLVPLRTKNVCTKCII